MTRFAQVALVTALLAACASGRGQVLLPLENEGELLVQILPVPASGKRLSIELASVSVVRRDGALVPLSLLCPLLEVEAPPRARLLASGRLEPGQYTGLSIKLSRAVVDRGGAPADLLLPAPPLTVDAPFALQRGRALLLELQLEGTPPDGASSFAPVFKASFPLPVLAQLAGLTAAAAGHQLGVFDLRSRALTGVVPTGREPWGVALDPVAGRAYVSLSGEDVVVAIDLTTSEELGRARLSSGDAPRELALTPDRRLLVTANSGSNTASFIDTAGLVEVGRAAAGQEPEAVLLDRTGTRAFVTAPRSSTLAVLDLANRSLVATLSTDVGPLRPQLSRTGDKLYVAHSRSPYVLVYSLPGLSLSSRLFVGSGISAIKVDPASDRLLVARAGEQSISVYQPGVQLPLQLLDVPGTPTWLSIHDAQNSLYALIPEQRMVWVIDLATGSSLGGLDLPEEPRSLVLAGERN